MSETFDQSPTTSSPPPNDLHHLHKTSPESPKLHNSRDLVSDIVLWRRKRVNVMILSAAAAAAWAVMDVYRYHFITLLSWLAIAILACLFFWGSMHRFLKKAADMSEFEISEETTVEQASC